MNGLSHSSLWPATSVLETPGFSAERAGAGALSGITGTSATLVADVEPEARGLSISAHAERVLGHLLSQPAGDAATF